MESEEGGHVIHAWIQPVIRGSSLDMRYIRKQLGVHGVETVGGEHLTLWQ